MPVGIHCFSGGSCITTGFEQQASSESSPGAALYSTDGGSTWASAAMPAGIGPVTSIWCSTASDCVATTHGNATEQLSVAGDVLVTTDAGETWTAAGGEGLPSSLLTVVSCSTSSSCWIAGVVPPAGRRPLTFVETKGFLASTSDQGQTWLTTQLPPAFDIRAVAAISCPDTTTCYAIGFQRPTSGPGKFVLLAYRNS